MVSLPLPFLLFVGIQYAGGHLKELQRAVQDPISNFGVVLGEVAKRGRSAIGIRFAYSKLI